MSEVPTHDMSSWNKLEAQLMVEIESAANGFKSTSGHECRLPVFVKVPVALNPMSSNRAQVGLTVQCMGCQTIWIAKRNISAMFSALDNYWSELDLSALSWRERRKLRKPQLLFDCTEYYMSARSPNIDGTRSTMP